MTLAPLNFSLNDCRLLWRHSKSLDGDEEPEESGCLDAEIELNNCAGAISQRCRYRDYAFSKAGVKSAAACLRGRSLQRQRLTRHAGRISQRNSLRW